MERWICKPMVSVGTIIFGMHRSEVRSMFTLEKEERQSKYQKDWRTYDDFGGFRVFYSMEDTVEAVEILHGIEVCLNGHILFPADLEDAFGQISGLLKKAENYIQPEMSIGLYASSGKLVSAMFGKKGYFISSILCRH